MYKSETVRKSFLPQKYSYIFMPAIRSYPQAKYWLLTIPHYAFTPYLPRECSFIRGQLELGRENRSITRTNGNLREVGIDSPSEQQSGSNMESGGPTWESNEFTGYLHWQIVVHFTKKVRRRAVINVFGPFHAEPTRSDAAEEYVWKDDTSVEGTRFELGSLPRKLNNQLDWDTIKCAAKEGRLDDIDSGVFVRNYSSLRRIECDFLVPIPIERRVVCLWGPTGTGKSRRAWADLGLDAYPKDPLSKFWCGYKGHTKVIIDEFRGGINLSHMLRWLDRYPVIVETKGGATVLKADTIYITSNLAPMMWYPNEDKPSIDALLRRMEIIEMN